MSLLTQIQDLITRVGTEVKTMKSQYSGNNTGSLTGLNTTNKSSLLSAINEVNTLASGKQANLGFTPENAANKGIANGYAGLDSGGKVPLAQLPATLVMNKGFFATEAALRAAHPTASAGDYAVVGATDTTWIWDVEGNDWVDGDTKGSVTSVNGATGAVVIGDAVAAGASGLMTGADKSKLNGIASGATANSTDAQLRDRSTHTGTQLSSTISDFAATVRSVVLTGLSLATSTAVAATDSILVAVGKLQAQITAHAGSGGSAHADVVAGGASGFMTGADKTKLNGIATGATANATDAQLRDRSTHTGTQSADTLTDGTTNKAFLATERTKLTGIATGATANDTDANLKNRANHTGTQLATTISDFAAAVLATVLTGFSTATQSAVVATDTVLSAIGKLQGQLNAHVGSGGSSHAVVVAAGAAGFMSGADKTKLDGIAANANNYVHPTTDGNSHLPANGTTNTNKVAKATAVAGVWTLDFINFSELANKPTTAAGYGITDVFTKTEIGDITTDLVAAFNAAIA